MVLYSRGLRLMPACPSLLWGRARALLDLSRPRESRAALLAIRGPRNQLAAAPFVRVPFGVAPFAAAARLRTRATPGGSFSRRTAVRL